MWFPVWDLSSGFRGFRWSLMVADLRLQGDANAGLWEDSLGY